MAVIRKLRRCLKHAFYSTKPLRGLQLLTHRLSTLSKIPTFAYMPLWIFITFPMPSKSKRELHITEMIHIVTSHFTMLYTFAHIHRTNIPFYHFSVDSASRVRDQTTIRNNKAYWMKIIHTGTRPRSHTDNCYLSPTWRISLLTDNINSHFKWRSCDWGAKR